MKSGDSGAVCDKICGGSIGSQRCWNKIALGLIDLINIKKKNNCFCFYCEIEQVLLKQSEQKEST